LKFNKSDIKNYLSKLSEELNQKGIKGEILIVGGAAMILSLDARESTHDIDAVYKPKSEIKDSIFDVGVNNDLEPGWMNDAVEVFMSNENFKKFLIMEFENLNVYVPEVQYILAMKVDALRTYEGATDIEDISLMIKELEIESIDEINNIFKSILCKLKLNTINFKQFYVLFNY